jgi:hypothetical protein
VPNSHSCLWSFLMYGLSRITCFNSFYFSLIALGQGNVFIRSTLNHIIADPLRERGWKACTWHCLMLHGNKGWCLTTVATAELASQMDGIHLHLHYMSRPSLPLLPLLLSFPRASWCDWERVSPLEFLARHAMFQRLVCWDQCWNIMPTVNMNK